MPGKLVSPLKVVSGCVDVWMYDHRIVTVRVGRFELCRLLYCSADGADWVGEGG